LTQSIVLKRFDNALLATLSFVRIGLISDTHGHIGLDAIEALCGCDQVIHAGDIGPGVLDRLSRLAPVIAVRGNNDIVLPEASLPTNVVADFRGVRVSVVHRLKDAPKDGWDVLVYGHSHRRSAERDGQKVIINPGAAGRAVFHERRSVAILNVDRGV
jgi:putative phosphoesterase